MLVLVMRLLTNWTTVPLWWLISVTQLFQAYRGHQRTMTKHHVGLPTNGMYPGFMVVTTARPGRLNSQRSHFAGSYEQSNPHGSSGYTYQHGWKGVPRLMKSKQWRCSKCSYPHCVKYLGTLAVDPHKAIITGLNTLFASVSYLKTTWDNNQVMGPQK